MVHCTCTVIIAGSSTAFYLVYPMLSRQGGLGNTGILRRDEDEPEQNEFETGGEAFRACLPAAFPAGATAPGFMTL